MSKELKHDQLDPSETNNEVSLSIDVDVKVGILHTIANAIYATPVGKIREAVANAKDNNATWILIVADPITKTLCIYDNGCGISKSRFREIFTSIGYPTLIIEPGEHLSYFGLGLMSIFQLGNKIKIFTHPTGEEECIMLEVNAEEFFAESNRDRSIRELKDFINLEIPGDRKKTKAPLLNIFIEDKLGGMPPSFTEIVIEDVKEDDLEEICKSTFIDELSKVLPLKVTSDEPFLKRFTGSKEEEVKGLLENKIFCSTIDVFFGVRGIEEDEMEDIKQTIMPLALQR